MDCRRGSRVQGGGATDVQRLDEPQKNLSGNYCPWIPTGGGNGNFQMEEREYIMPLR